MAKEKKVAKKIKRAKVLKPTKSRKILVKKKINKIKKTVRRVQGRQKNKIIKKAVLKTKQKKAVKKLVKKLTPRKVVAHKGKKHITRRTKINPAEEFPAQSFFKAKIKVIGIGGGGGSIVSEIGRSLEKATFVIADTDVRVLKKKSGIKYFWFGQDLTHGLGTGVNVDLAKQAAESAKEKISSIFKDQDIIIFVASLGGGLGSGATQVFAEAAREFGGITFGIFTMPFKFEGKNKYRIAQNALRALRQSLNVSLVIPNEKIFKVIDETTPITNAFSIVNKSLMESLESLIDLIYNPGIINIDFADLRTILRGRGSSAFLNTVEESGKDRIEKICENIFKNPLLQSSNLCAEKILFNISGGENLSMFEVEKISSRIAEQNQKAKIIFGISKNPKLKNKIKTTILMTGGQISDAEEDLPAHAGKIEDIEIKPVLAEKEVKKVIEPVKVETKAEIMATKKREKPLAPARKKEPKSKKRKKPLVPVKKPDKNAEKAVSFVPVFEVPVSPIPVLEQRRIDVIEAMPESGKKTIRRSGLEIRKAEELEEKKRLAQEKEWEIPAFLRKVKFKS